MNDTLKNRRMLARFAWLSIAAALITITLKTFAWLLTDSVGLLSDAMESLVNLSAAVLTLGMLLVAAKPPDDEHHYGYSKAEYLASGCEGFLILVAALAIGYAAIDRLIDPQPIHSLGIGVLISGLASAVNFFVARVLLREGKRHRSIALEADAHHLMTDVWTSIGVLAGVAAAVFTGWWHLDPLIALAVALNIVYTGWQLLRRSFSGLMDRAISNEDRAKVTTVLDSYDDLGVRYHALRTRQAAGRCFVSVHILVPGEWSVQRGHDMVEEIEARLRAAVPGASVFTHLEPVEDPASYEDVHLDR